MALAEQAGQGALWGSVPWPDAGRLPWASARINRLDRCRIFLGEALPQLYPTANDLRRELSFVIVFSITSVVNAQKLPPEKCIFRVIVAFSEHEFDKKQQNTAEMSDKYKGWYI